MYIQFRDFVCLFVVFVVVMEQATFAPLPLIPFFGMQLSEGLPDYRILVCKCWSASKICCYISYSTTQEFPSYSGSLTHIN